MEEVTAHLLPAQLDGARRRHLLGWGANVDEAAPLVINWPPWALSSPRPVQTLSLLRIYPSILGFSFVCLLCPVIPLLAWSILSGQLKNCAWQKRNECQLKKKKDTNLKNAPLVFRRFKTRSICAHLSQDVVTQYSPGLALSFKNRADPFFIVIKV